MKVRIGLACLLGLLIAVPTYAGTISFDFGSPISQTTTANQDGKLTALVSRDNVQRAAQDPPLAARTVEQYLRDVLLSAVQSYIREVNEIEAREACILWSGFTQAKKNAIITEFGGKAPCS